MITVQTQHLIILYAMYGMCSLMASIHNTILILMSGWLMDTVLIIEVHIVQILTTDKKFVDVLEKIGRVDLDV